MKTIQASDDNSKGGYPTDVTGQSVGTNKRAIHVAGKELVLGQDYDKIAVTYPTTSTEVYTYSLSAVTVFTIRVTYSTAAKEILTTVEEI